MIKNVAAVIFALATVFLSHSVAAAPTKPISTWACEDFLAVDADFQPKVVYFVTGRSKTGKLEAFEDILGTEKVFPMLIDECRKMPKDSFTTRLKSAWRAVSRDSETVGEKQTEKHGKKHGRKH